MYRLALYAAIVGNASQLVAQTPTPVTDPVKVITAADVAHHVAVIAADSMQGRDTPSRGLELTAQYVANQFKKFGLKPGGDSGTWFQRYPLPNGTGNAPNIMGVLEGSDPKLKGEYLVFSAHMDHVGINRGGADSIHNGDNASGTAGLIELAEAFSKSAARPRRSVIFLAVSGGTKGLWGSSFFVDHSAVPLKHIVANLNLDRIGRSTKDTVVAAGRTYSDLGATLGRVNAAHPELRLTVVDDRPEGMSFYGADQFSFARRGIPALGFSGMNPDAYGVRESAAKINAEQEARILRLVFHVGQEIANANPDQRPIWDPASYDQIARRGMIAKATPVQVQAPIVTSAGDPSVRNDTIYRLAVDPSAHAGKDAVFLFDDGVVRYEADGTGAETYRQVVQILTPTAVSHYAEHELAYSPGHQRLTINWMRVVRPDGTVVSEAPTQVQDADVPAAIGDPVYTDTKVRRFSLSGVAPGTIVDWSYTREELKPPLAGDFGVSWGFHTNWLTRRSRYVLDVPETFEPRIVERNLNFARLTQVANGRRVFTWATQEIPNVSGEQFMADSNGIWMSLQVSGASTWEGIARWYADLARGRDVVDDKVRAVFKPTLAGAKSADDTLRAIHRWVAQDIRYVSIALGKGAFQPRTPADVVATGYGDCKDKATLFIAAVTSLGFRAYPVLLNNGKRVERALPSIDQFDHAIAVVERPGGRVYVDLTAELTPYGELPPSAQGQFALVVHPDGTSEQVVLPESAPEANLSETRIIGTLSRDGYITASYEERGRGVQQYPLRVLFLKSLDSTSRVSLARFIAAKVYTGADADSLQLFDGRDLAADTRMAFRIVRGLAARPAGDGRTVILTLPFPSMRSMADVAAALEAEGPRRFPIDAEQVIGPIMGVKEFTLKLPDGWRADLPKTVAVKGKWGSYTAKYTQDGNQLRITHRLEGTRGVYPPETLPELLGWMRAIAADDVPYIVLRSR